MAKNAQLSVVVLAYVLATIFTVSRGLPVLDVGSGIDNATIEQLRASVNDTPMNLYVVRAVVYEIGILTEVDDNDTSFETQERVDLTFYDAKSNHSHIDLGNIPLPIQTNVSGQVLTGIIPVNIGAFSSPSELLQTLPLTGTIVNITHSDTAFYQLSKSNSSSGDGTHILDRGELGKLPNVAHYFPSLATAEDDSAEVGGSASNSLDQHND